MLKALFTNKYLYIITFSLIAFGAVLLYALDKFIMPEYTNYNEGVTVPDVTRISLLEAEELLTRYGLRFEVADRRANSAFPANYVIDQAPGAATIVKPNRKVYLTVNAAVKPQVIVPNVVNLSLRNAQIQLQNYGLEVGSISYESSRFKNAVLRQSVDEGVTVEKGTTVDLVVSDGLGDKIVEIPEIIGLRLPDAQLKIREAGLRVGEIRFQPIKDIAPNVVLDFTPKVTSLVEGESLTLVISERFELIEESEVGIVSADSTGNN
ncbi:MAG: PASTA domain-containing protein [Balneolales bacterium]|nr:PASTA domain-containing protein [Balneolales bacterium]